MVLGAVGLGTETSSALVGLRHSFICTPGQQLARCWLPPACLWGPCPSAACACSEPSAQQCHRHTQQRRNALSQPDLPRPPSFRVPAPIPASCSDQVTWPCDNAEEVNWTW